MQNKETPLMRQYGQIKSKHPDAILLFRLGDFYETFGADAELTAKACGITLTKRNNGAAGDIPLAGFPHHQLDNYLPRLVAAGYRVAVCEQLEDPKQARGIVRRDVVELVTPGVVLYDKLLEPGKPKYVTAVFRPTKPNDVIGIAFADVSTGEFSCGNVSASDVQEVFITLAPAEILVRREDRDWLESILHRTTIRPAITRLEDWLFDLEFSQNLLLRHFNTVTLKGFGIADDIQGICAAGCLLNYIGETQRGVIGQITKCRRFSVTGTMLLDEATRRNLEIHESMTGNRKGGLPGILDRTCSPMGSRMLRWWLNTPVTDRVVIEERLDAIESMITERSLLAELRQHLSSLGDLERILTRIVSGRANARDYAAFRSFIALIPAVRNVAIGFDNALLTKLLDASDDFPELHRTLSVALTDEPPLQTGSGKMVRPGYLEALDKAVEAYTMGRDWIAKYVGELRLETGITSLKSGYTSVFGFFLEVSKTHKDKVPDTFERKQTLTNAERYTTEYLRGIEERILNAEQDIVTYEQQVLDGLRSRITADTSTIQETARALAAIDCLASLAAAAIEHSFTRPTIHSDFSLGATGSRHPVIESYLPPGKTFVPNDISLDGESQILIVTGPNMSGKSSLLRQIGIIVFLSHIGSYVPAVRASVPITDRIFTRVGAQDNIAAGESTFLVEMYEAANILSNATRRSLVLLDEVGRGTATYDGISIAWAIVEYIHEKIGAKTVFATHYHELNQMADLYPRVKNVQVEVLEVENDIAFTHKLIEGYSNHSFGIHVAQMAGLPSPVVSSARRILQRLESVHSRVDVPVDGAPSVSSIAKGQVTLFALQDDEIRDVIRNLDVDNMTPVKALQVLAGLKSMIEE